MINAHRRETLKQFRNAGPALQTGDMTDQRRETENRHETGDIRQEMRNRQETRNRQ